MNSLSIGSPAPAFDLPTGKDSQVSNAAMLGKKVVLYFYPKDDTPGCTREALDFTASRADFDAVGVEIIGVSPDDLASHDKFKKKHGITLELGADTEQTVANAYGVWGEKSMYGRTYMGVKRTTVLIDREGKVARVWEDVKVPGHVEEVLEAAKALG